MSLPKFLVFHGRDADIINYSQTGTDDYGDPQTSSTRTSTKVVVDRGTVQKRQNEYQQAVDVDAIIYADDSLDIRDSDSGEFPSEVEMADTGTIYEVQLVVPEDSNIDRLLCQRI